MSIRIQHLAGLSVVTASLVLAGAGCVHVQGVQGLPESVAGEVLNRGALPQGTYSPAQEWAALSPAYSHMTGHAADDPSVPGGRVWEAVPGTDLAAKALLYGPYVEIPPGDYVAFFRLERRGEADEDTVATVDAVVDGAQTTLNSQDLTPPELPAGRYVEAPLPFVYHGGRLELRVFWPGYSSLRADTVTLFRLSGDNPRTLVHLAPQPTPSGFPRNLTPVREARPFPDIFPRSNPPASTLYVLDLRKQSPSWQMLALTLEGLVNRSRPQVYILFNDTDPFWLDRMKQQGWIKASRMLSGPEEMVRRFRSAFRGVIITDPALPASKNVATMLAGVDNAVVASPSLAHQLGLPIVADLRDRWHTSVEAYQWAFDHLWPRLNHHVIACSFPSQLGLRDYLVENKVFIFWLSGPIDGARPGADPQAELNLMERLLARMPVNIPVMSYPYAGKDVGIGEGPGVTLFAEFGKYLVGTTDCSNLSVHSGIHPGPLHQRKVAAPPLRPDKVYVSWIMSDGDNIPVLTVYNFPPLWKDPLRGTLPIGWSISPSASMLVPDVADYYYRTATPNDDFVSAVSGVGYTYPDSYGKRFRPPFGQQVFDGFLAQTATYMRRMDLTDAWIMGISRPDLIRRYAERIPTLQALFPDYGRRVSSYEDATYPTARSVPVFHAVTNWAELLSREQQIESLVSQIRSITPRERPAFLHLFIWNWGSDLPMLKEITRRLGSGYVAVRPDALASLYRQELARERVLVRVPPTVSTIQGQPIRFSGSVQDVVSRPIGVQISSSGLNSTVLRPARVKLSPGQSAPLSVSGIPTGRPVRITLSGAGIVRHVTTGVRQVPLSEILGNVAALLRPLSRGGRRSLQFVAHYNARDLSHSSGALALDPQAAAGEAWIVNAANAKSGYVVYGPYAGVPPGRYLALYRLKRMGPGAGAAVTVDTSESGGHVISATRTVTSDELPENQYRSIPLVFGHPGGALETRFLWPGEAPLAIDGVDLWRIIPGGKARFAP